MKTRILYCSVHTSPEDFETIFIQNGGVESVAQKYHTLFSNGMAINMQQRLTVLSSPPTRKLWLKLRQKSEHNNFYYIPNVAVNFLKYFVSVLYEFLFVLGWHILNIFSRKVVVVSATQLFKFSCAIFVSKLFFSKIMLITCDVPHMTLEQRLSRDVTNSSVFRNMTRLISRFLWKGVKYFDYYVFLTESMNDVINKRKKNYVVVEGFADNNLSEKTIVDSKFETNVIVYAGGLYEKYGVKILINAVEKYCDDVELWLFGAGEMVEYLKDTAFAKTKYCGLKLNQEIYEIEKKATLLVNPRFSHEEYTEYSFPSKVIEYMSTGTLTLMTKLKGIPEEYFDYCIPIEAETEEGIAEKINYAMSLSSEERIRLGERAAHFVLTKKNFVNQTAKVIKMII